MSQAASLSARPQQRALPSWRHARMTNDVAIFITRVGFSLVCFSVCSQPQSSKSHGIRFPSVGDIIILSCTTQAGKRNKTFFLFSQIYVKWVRPLQLPQLFVYFLVIFFFPPQLAFFYYTFLFPGWSLPITGSTSVETSEDCTF